MLPLQTRVNPGTMEIKGVLRIPQNSSITGASISDCLMSYPGHSLGESYFVAEKQSVYSTAPVYWGITLDGTLINIITPGQSGPGYDDYEGVLRIPQSFSITGASPSDCLVTYPGQSFGGRSLTPCQISYCCVR